MKNRQKVKLEQGIVPKLQRKQNKAEAKRLKDEAREQHRADRKASKPKNQDPNEGSGSGDGDEQ